MTPGFGWTGGNARRLHRISLLFGGGEEDQNLQFFLDVVETMFQFSLNENYGAGTHLGVLGGALGTDLHAGASSNNVVHLIFTVRPLGIDRALGKNVDSGAHA